MEKSEIGLELTEEKKFEMLQKSNYRYDEQKISTELNRMRRSISKRAVSYVFYMFHRLANHLCSGVYVDTVGINKIKALMTDKQTRIVLLPLYRSITDIIVTEYINYLYDIELGFFFACMEDHTDMRLLNELYKFCGVFLPKRERRHDNSINYVNQALFEDVLAANKLTTIYQNTKRLRSGKISQPLRADDSIEWILRAQKNPALQKFNIKIVPVSIYMDRIFDSSLLT